MAREEALGQLQRERAALEEARAMLKQQEEEVSRLNGELVQISISHEDLCQSLVEQEASFLKLQRQAEEAHQSLEGRRSRSKVSLLAPAFRLLIRSFGIRSQLVFLCSWLSGLRTALGHATTQAEVVQAAYNSSQQELEELRAAALETCQGVEEGEA
jgi:predicted  nucleic acid-binding Zn-ribbon protein